jgi:hypothetical protein
MGRPLPTPNMLILVAPTSLLSDCFFATSTMLDRLRGLEQASQSPLPLRGEGGLHGRSPWHEAHPARLSSWGWQLNPGRRPPCTRLLVIIHS